MRRNRSYKIIDKLAKRSISGDPESGSDFSFNGVPIFEDVLDGKSFLAEDIPFLFCSAEFGTELFGFFVEVNKFLHGDRAEVFEFVS
jgi:hypothetical protein